MININKCIYLSQDPILCSLRLSWTLVRPVDSRFSLCVEFEFRVLIVNGIPDSLGWILDFKAQDSGFHQQRQSLAPVDIINTRERKQREQETQADPSVSNLSPRPCRYLLTVTRSSSQGSAEGRWERLERLATFDSLWVQRLLKARSRMESRTVVCYLDAIWRRLEPLERIYGRFP